jgi:outer membrane protein
MSLNYLKKFFIFNIIIFFTSAINANEKIVFIDINYILNTSLAGKSILKSLEKQQKKDIENYKQEEKKLKNIEEKLIASKNVMEEKDYIKKVSELRKKIQNYKNLRVNKQNELLKEKSIMKQKLLSALNPILTNYSKENSISMIISKDKILIGKIELDITEEIINILNKKVKSLK